MTASTPLNEPIEVTAGDYVTWQKNLPDYPAGTWTLAYTLINSTDKISITATASGLNFLVAVPAATSAAWSPGDYPFQAYVTFGSQRFTVGSGVIKVKPNFAAASTLDNRSQAKRTLDAIEAVIENRASQDQQEYTIGNRSLKRTPMADLIVLRDKYRSIYVSEQNAERIKNGGAGKNRILVRF